MREGLVTCSRWLLVMLLNVSSRSERRRHHDGAKQTRRLFLELQMTSVDLSEGSQELLLHKKTRCCFRIILQVDEGVVFNERMKFRYQILNSTSPIIVSLFK